MYNQVKNNNNFNIIYCERTNETIEDTINNKVTYFRAKHKSRNKFYINCDSINLRSSDSHDLSKIKEGIITRGRSIEITQYFSTDDKVNSEYHRIIKFINDFTKKEEPNTPSRSKKHLPNIFHFKGKTLMLTRDKRPKNKKVTLSLLIKGA